MRWPDAMYTSARPPSLVGRVILQVTMLNREYFSTKLSVTAAQITAHVWKA